MASGGSVEFLALEKRVGEEALFAVGEALDLGSTLHNEGAVAVLPGATLRVTGGTLDNRSGAIVELLGDAAVGVQLGGTFTSAGTIEKSVGTEEAAIFASSATFETSGTLRVSAGALRVSGGSIRGIVDIGGGAVLRQSSTTTIQSINSRGDGLFEITGQIECGTFAGQSVSLDHVVLNSASSLGPAISGVATVHINRTLTWQRGTVGNLPAFVTSSGTVTRFETTGSKSLTNTTWESWGSVEGDQSLDLSLQNGAGIRILGAGRWTQANGGKVSLGLNGASGIAVEGELHKIGEGAFVVETPLDCWGTLNLVDGALTVQGAFRLLQTGLITGGGTGDLSTRNIRLIVVDAPSAELNGTVRPDLDGGYALFDIQGAVTLGSTFRAELDVPITGDLPTENLTFLTGGQVLGGTLALNVVRPPTAGVNYQVVSMVTGSGTFATITGAEPFTEIIQDDRGVLVRR